MEPKRDPTTNKISLNNQSKKKLRFKLFLLIIFSFFFNFCRFWCPSWRVGPRSGRSPLPCNPSHIGYRLSLCRNFFRAVALFPLPELARGRKERHMTNGCEHLLLFGFIFQIGTKNATKMLQISTKMKPKCSQKLIKWCPEASKNRSERQGRALMAERLPKLTKI